ncbi:alanine racemase [Oceanibium sediminis]|uniref:alanine racemase n=1 Tax=Oceanibium sediminis TaxID=2026339 RepID=UPI000DD47CD9
MLRPTLTIDLGAIAANWTALNRLGSVETGAVVKADAYGLGIAPVARALATAGARTFFVATLDEAVALRSVIGQAPVIYVFSGYMPGAGPAVKQAGLRPLLNSPEQVAAYRAAHPGAPCGLQLDSGMNRLGLEAEDLAALDLTGMELSLVMSHLACADAPEHPQNAAQRSAFEQMTAGLPGIPRSLAATGGALLGPSYHFDMTRPGVGLFGGAPFTAARPVVQLEIPVIQTRTVRRGESVGYGAAWVAERDSRVATLAVGYADGLIRAMSGGVSLFAGDRRCPAIGRISMDLLAADVTDLPTAPDSLFLLNDLQGVDDLADAAGTIGYEILTSLGARYERVYIAG